MEIWQIFTILPFYEFSEPVFETVSNHVWGTSIIQVEFIQALIFKLLILEKMIEK